MRHVAIFILALALASCGGATKVERPEGPPGAEYRPYEEDFHPIDYEPLPKAPVKSDTLPLPRDTTPAMTPPISTELVPGYRVQILSTTDIDEANAKKAEAEALFPDERFYLVYDQPTYKVRAGNFQKRYEADRFAKVLTESGYRGAWIVPDRVYRIPPPLVRPAVKDSVGR